MARTRVTNHSGASQFFGFLPPHGKTLAAAEEVIVEGDLRTLLASGRGRYGRPSELASLEVAELDGSVLVERIEVEPSSSSSS